MGPALVDSSKPRWCASSMNCRGVSPGLVLDVVEVRLKGHSFLLLLYALPCRHSAEPAVVVRGPPSRQLQSNRGRAEHEQAIHGARYPDRGLTSAHLDSGWA
jgi:hypothetical protein